MNRNLLLTSETMENQETMMKKRDFVAERVKCRIDGLLEEADNYTRIMNEDYESFFMDHAEDMYKVQLELSEYRKLKAVVSSGSLERYPVIFDK